jgi:phytoene/squalene synthetase
MNRAQRRLLKRRNKGVIKMSERTLDQVRNDYMETLKALGDKDFRKAVLESEIQELRIKLSDLNKEAAAIPAQAAPEVNPAPDVPSV